MPPTSSHLTTTPATAAIPVDTFAEVVVDALSFREAPSTGAARIQEFELLQRGDLIFLVEGPVEADGYEWYRVAAFRPPGPGVTAREAGWVAAWPADSPDDAHIATTDTQCPDEPIGVTELMEVEGLQAVVCFGDREIVFRAWVTETTGLGGNCYCETTPEWLADPFGRLVALDDEETAYIVDGDGDWFSAYTNPEAGVEDPGLHQWVEVTGHYDDPAAQTCEWTPTDPGAGPLDPTIVVLDCRARFVATAFHPVEGP